MQTLEPKFVLLDANHSTTDKDWEQLIVVFISPAPTKKGFKIPALLRKKSDIEPSYELHAMAYDNGNVQITQLTKSVELRIRHQYETSYLFGKDMFHVGFLEKQGEIHATDC